MHTPQLETGVHEADPGGAKVDGDAPRPSMVGVEQPAKSKAPLDSVSSGATCN